MLDNLLSRYKYIQNNFEYKQKTYDKACEITGVMLELEGEYYYSPFLLQEGRFL